jgi:hypothetical protein
MAMERSKLKKEALGRSPAKVLNMSLTINLELDQRHNATASKDRTGLFMGKPAFVPSEKTGEAIAQWCE